jgi:hypothetical protein
VERRGRREFGATWDAAVKAWFVRLPGWQFHVPTVDEAIIACRGAW